MVGILPTLRAEELRLAALSDAARYRALNNGIRRLRQEPFRIRIDGADPLELAADDIGLEGANTSFQVHLRVDPDGSRPLQRRPAGHRPGAGRGRQLPHLPRPPAVGGDPGGAVQAGGGRPGRRRPVQPPHLPGRLWDRLDRHRRLGAAGGERPAARAGAAGARRGTPPGAGGGRPGPRPGGAAPAPEHGLALEPGHLRPGRRRPPPHRAAGPARRADGGRHAGQRRLRCSASPWPWPPTPTPGSARSPFQQAHHNFYRAAQLGLRAELAWPLGPGRPGGDGPGGPADPAAAAGRPPGAGGRRGASPRRPAGCWPWSGPGPPPARPAPSGSAGPWPPWNRSWAASRRWRPCWNGTWSTSGPATRSTPGRSGGPELPLSGGPSRVR